MMSWPWAPMVTPEVSASAPATETGSWQARAIWLMASGSRPSPHCCHGAGAAVMGLGERSRALANSPRKGSAVKSAGAYGMAMASNYNTRPRAVELMVDGDRVHVVRQRETVAQLFAGESILPQ